MTMYLRETDNIFNETSNVYVIHCSWQYICILAVIIFSVKLSSTNDLNYGKLEINFNDTWLSVCDTNFDVTAAKVFS